MVYQQQQPYSLGDIEFLQQREQLSRTHGARGGINAYRTGGWRPNVGWSPREMQNAPGMKGAKEAGLFSRTGKVAGAATSQLESIIARKRAAEASGNMELASELEGTQKKLLRMSRGHGPTRESTHYTGASGSEYWVGDYEQQLRMQMNAMAGASSVSQMRGDAVGYSPTGGRPGPNWLGGKKATRHKDTGETTGGDPEALAMLEQQARQAVNQRFMKNYRNIQRHEEADAAMAKRYALPPQLQGGGMGAKVQYQKELADYEQYWAGREKP